MDYETGNIGSIFQIIRELGHKATMASCQKDLEESSMIVLPGVGAFPEAMKALNQKELVSPLVDLARRGKPIFGICLGMQLLAEESEEITKTSGLGLIPGKVCKIGDPPWHIGWNRVYSLIEGKISDCLSRDDFYFNHSFCMDCPSEYVIGTSWLGRTINVAVRKDNIMGVQFHPEKSQSSGLNFMCEFIQEFCNA